MWLLIGRRPANHRVGFRPIVYGLPIALLLAMLVFPATAHAAFDPALTRAPYLTDLVGNHVNVNWATNQAATTGSLQWGPVSAGSCSLSNSLTATRTTVTVGTVAEYQWKGALNLPS